MNARCNLKIHFYFFFSFVLINFTNLFAEEEEIYLKSISDQIQVITKDLKTLEKAVYQKSDACKYHDIKF